MNSKDKAAKNKADKKSAEAHAKVVDAAKKKAEAAMNAAKAMKATSNAKS